MTYEQESALTSVAELMGRAHSFDRHSRYSLKLLYLAVQIAAF
ncbi:hypothetical protein [Paraburkholderia monticola]|nr:hypothetical protein [Paraburkholderia monticola]